MSRMAACRLGGRVAGGRPVREGRCVADGGVPGWAGGSLGGDPSGRAGVSRMAACRVGAGRVAGGRPVREDRRPRGRHAGAGSAAHGCAGPAGRAARGGAGGPPRAAARTVRAMDAAEARRRFAAARVARLATADADGRPHLVPVVFAVDGDRVWSAVDDVKPKATMRLRRLRNIAANPAVALLADHYDDEDWTALWWARADGAAQLLDPADPARAAGPRPARRPLRAVPRGAAARRRRGDRRRALVGLGRDGLRRDRPTPQALRRLRRHLRRAERAPRRRARDLRQALRAPARGRLDLGLGAQLRRAARSPA